MERDHSFVDHRSAPLRRKGAAYLSSITKLHPLAAPKWAQFPFSHQSDLPQRDLKSNIRTATKRTEKTAKMWNMIIDPKTGYHIATT